MRVGGEAQRLLRLGQFRGVFLRLGLQVVVLQLQVVGDPTHARQLLAQFLELLRLRRGRLLLFALRARLVVFGGGLCRRDRSRAARLQRLGVFPRFLSRARGVRGPPAELA